MAYYAPPPPYAPPPAYAPPPGYAPPPVFSLPVPYAQPYHAPPVSYAPQQQPTIIIQQSAQPQQESRPRRDEENEPENSKPTEQPQAANSEEAFSRCCFAIQIARKKPHDYQYQCCCWKLFHIKTVCQILLGIEMLIICVQWYFVRELDDDYKTKKGVAGLVLLMTLVLLVGIICCVIGILNNLPNLVLAHVVAQGVVIGCLVLATGLEAYAVTSSASSYLRVVGLFAYMLLQIWWFCLFCQLKSYVTAVAAQPKGATKATKC